MPSTQTPGLLQSLFAKQPLPGIGPTFPEYAPPQSDSGLASAISTGGSLINSILQRKHEQGMIDKELANRNTRIAGMRKGMEAAAAAPEDTSYGKLMSIAGQYMHPEDLKEFGLLLQGNMKEKQVVLDKKLDRQTEIDVAKEKSAAERYRADQKLKGDIARAETTKKEIKEIPGFVGELVDTLTPSIGFSRAWRRANTAHRLAKEHANDKNKLNFSDKEFGGSRDEWEEKETLRILGLYQENSTSNTNYLSPKDAERFLKENKNSPVFDQYMEHFKNTYGYTPVL